MTSTLGPGDIADLALVVCIGIFAAVAVAALLAYLADRARLRLAAQLLGQRQPVPAGLFDRRPGSERMRGVVLVATGIGVALYFVAGGEPALARAGLIPGAVGAGYLVGHWLERRGA